MARWDKCFAGIRNAAGRDLTDAEIGDIFLALDKAAKDIKAGRISVSDAELPASAKGMKSPIGANVVFEMAAKQAADELIAEAARNERNVALQLNRISARRADIKNLRADGMKGLDVVRGVLMRDYSGQFNIESFEQHYTGVRDMLRAPLMATWEALGKDFAGFFQNGGKLVDLIKELRGEESGNPLAKKGAKAYHETAEQARQWFNENGGDIGKLDDPYMPQGWWHQELVARASEVLGKGKSDDPAVNRKAFVDHLTPKLLGDKHYVDDLGNPWKEAALREHLSKAWENIATDGLANQVPGQFTGVGKVANRHAEHRQIHFQSADDVMEAWNLFGGKSGIEILQGHIDSMARDIAATEFLGPNPQLTYRTLRDEALQDAVKANPRKTEKLKGEASKLDDAFDYISGRTKPSANPTLSAVANGLAHLNVAGKLGGSFFASLYGDKPMLEAVSHMNEIPVIQRWRTETSILNPSNVADRRALMREGLMADAVRSGLQRYYEGLGGGGGTASQFERQTGKLANAVMRVTGMNAINELRKGAFGAGLFSSIGHELSTGKAFADLADSDVRVLKTFGVTKEDWAVWKLATLTDLNIGSTKVPNALTPSAIGRIPDAALHAAGFDDAPTARRDAIVKLLGAVNTESEFAIVTPGWKERAQFYAGLQRGTIRGEITRSWFQFKSFPWTFFQRGMDAVANQDTVTSKATMSAYLIATTTMAGAMIMQTRAMLSGQDPRKMMDKNWYKFWSASFIQGGALGIYGDFIYGVNQNRYGGGMLTTAAGPTLGPLLELGVVQPLDAIQNTIEGKKSHFLGKEFQDAKGFVPGGNIWYLKGALDHLVWQQVMEGLSPGYLRTIRERTRKDYNQNSWWEPGQLTPDRAPDVSQAFAR